MKNRSGIAVIGILFLLSCNIRNSHDEKTVGKNGHLVANTEAKTSVQMIDSVFNFGKVKDGEKVVYSFRFQNTGENPLVISSATASCGCTVPEKPDRPIAPGESGVIKVVFDSKGRVGPVHKEVSVTSNARPSMPTLILSGEVTSD